jgi:hypothetical protein
VWEYGSRRKSGQIDFCHSFLSQSYGRLIPSNENDTLLRNSKIEVTQAGCLKPGSLEANQGSDCETKWGSAATEGD